MADTVTNTALFVGGNATTVLLTCISDGTGNTTTAVDKSAMADRFGSEPARLRITEAKYCVQGFPYIKVAFDHDADQTALVLSGTGKLCLRDAAVKDAGGAGGTGDILVTAPAGANTGSYTLALTVAK